MRIPFRRQRVYLVAGESLDRDRADHDPGASVVTGTDGGEFCMEHSEAEASNQRISHETMKFFGFRTSAEVMSQHIK